ncbi:cation diffusion facilitator family transporter [Candidatus Nitrosopumilus salaria BD31]|uniref:Cation diffusion facilitator family transporter n=1 Tax=Candidatus Nitrosopumilus salarius BD31 TaxID=859350 RepID=I3D4J4_9ARCH|nr:cation diffusion facilitator family transporter [Candidatus Nitrosopumilus salaria]EIJ66637.1 cation diffusion facilitator family transporter [Candidatus Nitrosopumilus salaria BD31]
MTKTHSDIEKQLGIVFVIAVSLFVFEFIGGVLSNSLALIADSFHVMLDFVAIGISLVAFRIAKKKHSSTHTFGFHRVEIIAAFVNGISLIATSIFIVIEANKRFSEPPEIDTVILVIFASVGLVANIIMAKRLEKHSHSNLNVHGSYLHVLGDLLSSIGVIVGAVIMMISSYFIVDVVVSIGIALVILRSGIVLCKKCLHIFMEGTPEEIKVSEVTKDLLNIGEIVEVHDLHIWTLTSNLFSMTVHIKIKQDALHQPDKILKKINWQMKEKFGITHCTIQIESEYGFMDLDD